MQNFLISSTFGPTTPKIFGFSQDFPLFQCNISHMRIQTYHHGASRICKNLQIFWPKTIFVCKATFYIFKDKSARIYSCKAIFTYSEITAQNKIYVCNRFGRNGILCLSFGKRATLTLRYLLLGFPCLFVMRLSLLFCALISGTGDSQRDSRESIRANHPQSNPYSASGRFARITPLSLCVFAFFPRILRVRQREREILTFSGGLFFFFAIM